MKIILTSKIGGHYKVDGVRIPTMLSEDNDLLHTIKMLWPHNARVLIICSDPNDYEKNDAVCSCMKESFLMSGLSVDYVDKCDDRSLHLVEGLQNVDVIILAGGHVPTQNRFMKRLKLKERLQNYNGIVITISAGSMNCADVVYASPELEFEAIDPNYKRWIDGLGLTDINVYPHFQELREEYLDGMRVVEDIVFPDSFTHEIIALNDGSYIFIDEDKKTLYGEAYSIKDGIMKQICSNGKSVVI